MKKHHKRLLTKILLVVIILSVAGFASWYILQNKTSDDKTAEKQSQTSNDTVASTNNEQKSSSPEPTTEKLEAFKLENEGLTFNYDPRKSSLATEPPRTEDGAYEVVAKIMTGAVILKIDAGISGIGGYMPCENIDRGSCEVIDTVEGTYLGEKVKYILVKASLPDDCGYSGKPDCNVAPLVTSYYIDTYESSEAPYGSCCGTLSSNARNLGNKAEIAGRVLITIQPDKSIQNENMLKNKDMLETFKIIESISYAAE